MKAPKVLWIVAAAPKAFLVVAAMVFFESTVAGVNHFVQSIISGAQVNGMRFSADSKTVYGAGEDFARMRDRHGMVWVWDAETGRLRWKRRTDKPVSPAALSSDGRFLLTDGWECNPMVWDTATGKLLCKLEQDPKQAERGQFYFSPDSQCILGGFSRGIQVWDGQTGVRKAFWKIPGNKTIWLYDLQFSTDGKRILVSVGGDANNFQLWDGSNGRVLKSFHTDLYTCALSPSGNKVAVVKQRHSSNKDSSYTNDSILTVVVRDVISGAGRIQSPEFPPFFDLDSLEFVSENTLLCKGGYGRSDDGGHSQNFLWDTRTNRLVEQLIIRTDAALGGSLSPDGRLEAVVNHGGYRHRPPLGTIYDAATGAKLRELEGLAGR